MTRVCLMDLFLLCLAFELVRRNVVWLDSANLALTARTAAHRNLLDDPGGAILRVPWRPVK